MNKKALKIGLVLVAVMTVFIQYNSAVVEIVELDSNSFCMYIDSYTSDDLVLTGCFNGDPHNVNSFNKALTERMEEEMPVISMVN